MQLKLASARGCTAACGGHPIGAGFGNASDADRDTIRRNIGEMIYPRAFAPLKWLLSRHIGAYIFFKVTHDFHEFVLNKTLSNLDSARPQMTIMLLSKPEDFFSTLDFVYLDPSKVLSAFRRL